MKVLDLQTYDAILQTVLTRDLGLSPVAVKRLLESRWPMNLAGVLSECDGRGWAVDRADIEDFVVEFAPPPQANVPLGEILAGPEFVENFLAWCIEHSRGKPTLVGRLHQGDPERIDIALNAGGYQA